MNLPILLFVHLLSLVIAVAVLFEYRQLRRGRIALLEALGQSGVRDRAGLWLTAGYLLSIVLTAAASAYIFSLSAS